MNYMKQMNRFQGFFFIVKIGFSVWERHRNWFEELARVLDESIKRIPFLRSTRTSRSSKRIPKTLNGWCVAKVRSSLYLASLINIGIPGFYLDGPLPLSRC